jgi:pimeloyl-ACP methyl ester carboxylesterase
MRFFLLLGIAPLLLSCSEGATTAAPVDPAACTATAQCAARLQIGAGVYLPLYTTYSLQTGSTKVRHALIIIHGADRNADTYFGTGVTAAQQSGRFSETIVIAPHFQKIEDGPRADEPYWTESGWKQGHLSVTGGPTPRVSSYTSLDRIIAMLADQERFPELRTVAVAGHSAGGQVVHRYAAGSQAGNNVAHLTIRYIVTNPSTYLYLGPERAAGSGFAEPDINACPDYDSWHMGLNGMNTYMNAVPVNIVREQLTQRDVVILLGSADTGSAQLDVSCGANLQGEHRYDRGLRLMQYMDALHPGHEHSVTVVPDVGHSSRNMFTSAGGRSALFGM